MGDSPASDSSHESGDEHQNSTSKHSAVKDKECQYCHQHFTSSSLGRHLDQFLFKKKPDGIHDVDEIRRLRGGITRRTARGGKRDREGSHSSRPSPVPSSIPQSVKAPTYETLNRAPPGGIDFRLNRLNWQATGVITDTNNIYPSSPPGKKRSFSTFTSDISPTDAVDTARALELSLREVLDTLRAASVRAMSPPSPFTFDIQTQSFPSLCLAMLPPPPTLYQSSPFSTLQTIPISPPGPDQLQPLRLKLTNTIDNWKWDALRLAQPTTSNIADEAAFLTRSAAEYTDATLNHLETAYQNWMAHPSEIRQALWNLELLRAFKSEQSKVADLEERTEQLQQEANQLQLQVEHLSRCQWPREMALWPPERRTMNKAMREEVRTARLSKPSSATNQNPEGRAEDDSQTERRNDGSKAAEKWDFDKLVNKWKAHVKEDRSRRVPYVQAQATASAASTAANSHHHPATGTPVTSTMNIKAARLGSGDGSGIHTPSSIGGKQPTSLLKAESDNNNTYSNGSGSGNGHGLWNNLNGGGGGSGEGRQSPVGVTTASGTGTGTDTDERRKSARQQIKQIRIISDL